MVRPVVKQISFVEAFDLCHTIRFAHNKLKAQVLTISRQLISLKSYILTFNWAFLFIQSIAHSVLPVLYPLILKFFVALLKFYIWTLNSPSSTSVSTLRLDGFYSADIFWNLRPNFIRYFNVILLHIDRIAVIPVKVGKIDAFLLSRAI